MTTQRKALATLGWYGTREERDQFLEYWNRGGTLSFNQWRKRGKPKPTVSAQPEWLTSAPRTAELMGTEGFAEKMAKAEAARGAGLPIPGRQPPAKPLTEEDAYEKSEREEREWERERWKSEFGLKERQFEAEEARRQREMLGEITPYQQQYLDLQRAQQQQAMEQQQALIGWYQEQAAMQQQEQERQYYSSLLASPMSWLQAEAYRGTTPVVQEWMKPLMSGQYQTGQQIPGWMGRQGEGQAMGSLPELRTPSAQLWGRMGPTAQAQYMGYGQARTGIRPEETMFRLGASAPPSGRFGGLRRMR